jgi:starvation-inducible outer membrane lipoprotein
VIQVLPQNGTTFIEVLQVPLGSRGKPEEAYASEGKYLILSEKSLDFSRFNRGEKLTVVGEIHGAAQEEKIKSLSGKDYRYPVILGEEIYLWHDYLYHYSSPEPYVGPWWYESPSRELRF